MLTAFADGHPLAAPMVHPGGRELRRSPRRPTCQKYWCREGDRTPMSLRSKVFEFYADQASTATTGHTLSLFSNLSGSTESPILHMVPSEGLWSWHKIDTFYR
jgi:hypothetical protein